jgi:hypothetical protein
LSRKKVTIGKTEISTTVTWREWRIIQRTQAANDTRWHHAIESAQCQPESKVQARLVWRLEVEPGGEDGRRFLVKRSFRSLQPS